MVLIAATFAVVLAAPIAMGPTSPPPVPPGTPSISQYVETVPTSAGSTTTGAGTERRRALEPSVAARLRATPDVVSQTLEAAATSSTYGAPQRDLPRTADIGRDPSATIGTLQAVTRSLSDSTDRHGLLLLAALLATVTLVISVAARRRR
jgi:uncharacterized membrane protein